MSWQATQWVGSRFAAGDIELSSLARSMAWAIAWRINPETRLTYSGKKLAAICGCSERSLSAPLQQLADAGIYVIERRPGKAHKIHLPADAVRPVPDAVRDYPHPAPHSVGSPSEVVHTPRPTATHPALHSAPPRVAQRDVPEYLPERDTRSGGPPSTEELSDLIDLALAAARLERRQAQAEGVKIRNVAGYERAIAERLQTDDIDKLRHALAQPATTHERAEYIVGKRRNIA
jgi:biotin operon repressor